MDIDNYAVVDGKYFYFDAPSVPFGLLAGRNPDYRTLPLYSRKPWRSVVFRTEITPCRPRFHHLAIELRSNLPHLPSPVRLAEQHQCTPTNSMAGA